MPIRHPGYLWFIWSRYWLDFISNHPRAALCFWHMACLTRLKSATLGSNLKFATIYCPGHSSLSQRFFFSRLQENRDSVYQQYVANHFCEISKMDYLWLVALQFCSVYHCQKFSRLFYGTEILLSREGQIWLFIDLIVYHPHRRPYWTIQPYSPASKRFGEHFRN